MKTKYEMCHEKSMDKYMKKFEKGELKDRSDKEIKSRKQAVAISLSISDSKCIEKLGKKDYNKMEENFNKNMYNNNDIKDDKLNYTTVKNGIILFNYYKKMKNRYKAKKIKNDLVIRTLKSVNSNFINKQILGDVIKLLEE